MSAARASTAGLDRAGMCCSALCAVHCLASAVAPGVLAAVGMGGLLSHEAEWSFTAAAVLLGAVAAGLSLRRRRSHALALAFAACAAGLLLARGLEALGSDEIGLVVTLASGLGLALTHVLNLRACRDCGGTPCPVPSRPEAPPLPGS